MAHLPLVQHTRGAAGAQRRTRQLCGGCSHFSGPRSRHAAPQHCLDGGATAARRLTACASSSAAQGKVSSKTQGKAGVNIVKEAHKVFDEVFISVQSGNGGRGEIVEAGRGKWVDNFKYKPGGNSPKRIWLPASEPADGADGGDVVLRCDPEVDNLLHLHKQRVYAARNGSNANPAVGSAGPKKNKDIKKAKTPALILSVPPGTVVKRKSTGALLGELINPGDTLVVARGGKGGSGVRAPSRAANLRELNRQQKLAEESGAEVVAVEDSAWQAESNGMPGGQLSLHLLLRVVADIGIVGFPNAGKSSLLRALTRASPEVAPYPFTTLMPNLGVLAPEPQPGSGASSEFQPPARRSQATPVLADLPGLIEGAHKGKGLGRMFLRHLRRTSALLHVVDAAAQDPATDYYAVREELRMYNPEYCAKPHVVALNKMDMEDASGLRDELITALQLTAQRHCQEWEGEEVKPTMPVAVVACSALSGEGLGDLRAAMQAALSGKASTSSASRPAGSKASRPDSKQGLATAVAAALGGAAASAAVLGSSEAQPETAGEAELAEQERWLLGLSDQELLELEGGREPAVEGAQDMSTAAQESDGWGASAGPGVLRRQRLTEAADQNDEDEGYGDWDEGELDEGEFGDLGKEGEDGEAGAGNTGKGESEEDVGADTANQGELLPEELDLLNLTEEELLKLVQD